MCTMVITRGVVIIAIRNIGKSRIKGLTVAGDRVDRWSYMSGLE